MTAGRCNSCEVLMINGVRCHETDCPDSWRDYDRSCDWCGSAFRPGTSDQRFCCDDCAECYTS